MKNYNKKVYALIVGIFTQKVKKAFRNSFCKLKWENVSKIRIESSVRSSLSGYITWQGAFIRAQ